VFVSGCNTIGNYVILRGKSMSAFGLIDLSTKLVITDWIYNCAFQHHRLHFDAAIFPVFRRPDCYCAYSNAHLLALGRNELKVLVHRDHQNHHLVRIGSDRLEIGPK